MAAGEEQAVDALPQQRAADLAGADQILTTQRVRDALSLELQADLRSLGPMYLRGKDITDSFIDFIADPERRVITQPLRIETPILRIQRTRSTVTVPDGGTLLLGGLDLEGLLAGEDLRIYGDGTQTRDLLYAGDCARFVCDALVSDAATGRILNAGTGADVSVNALAALVERDPARVVHVPHIHPQSEIAVLRCDARLAGRLRGWVV
mgnify:CR=1 FL=1